MKPHNLVKRYIWQVHLLLPMTKKNKRYVKSLQKELQVYLYKNPDSTMKDLYENYGTPKAAIQSYLKNLEEEDLRQLLSLRKWKRVITACCITVFVAFVVVFSVNLWYWHDYKVHLYQQMEKNDETTTYGMGDEDFWKKIP